MHYIIITKYYHFLDDAFLIGLTFSLSLPLLESALALAALVPFSATGFLAAAFLGLAADPEASVSFFLEAGAAFLAFLTTKGPMELRLQF